MSSTLIPVKQVIMITTDQNGHQYQRVFNMCTATFSVQSQSDNAEAIVVSVKLEHRIELQTLYSVYMPASMMKSFVDLTEHSGSFDVLIDDRSNQPVTLCYVHYGCDNYAMRPHQAPPSS